MHNAIPARPALQAIDAIEPRAPQWAPAICCSTLDEGDVLTLPNGGTAIEYRRAGVLLVRDPLPPGTRLTCRRAAQAGHPALFSID